MALTFCFSVILQWHRFQYLHIEVQQVMDQTERWKTYRIETSDWEQEIPRCFCQIWTTMDCSRRSFWHTTRIHLPFILIAVYNLWCKWPTLWVIQSQKRTVGELPPCNDTLCHYVKRANYQAAIGQHCLEKFPCVANPTYGHSWSVDNGNLTVQCMSGSPDNSNKILTKRKIVILFNYWFHQ